MNMIEYFLCGLVSVLEYHFRKEKLMKLHSGIASILIILILINSIGCYSYNHIKKEDSEKIEEDDEVKITTIDEKVYILTDVTIRESEVKGFVDSVHSEWWRDIKGKEIVLSLNEIKKFEVEEIDVVTPILIVLGVVFTGWIVFWAIMYATYEK